MTDKEVELLDDMLVALVDLLEEKGIVTHEEWEERIEKRISEGKKLKKMEDVEKNEKG
ncbi:MAG: hypothetical protein ACLFU5_00765 [Thermoplasmata archaeon]